MTPETNAPIPSLFDRITGLLNSHNASYQIIEHEPIDVSAVSSSAVTGTRPEQGAKALVMMINGIKPIMVVLRGPDRADRKAIKKLTESKDVRMATPEEVQETTQVEIGTLPAIGSLFNLPTYVDRLLLEEKEIAFGTGLHTRTIVMNTTDFRKVADPIIVGDFAKG